MPANTKITRLIAGLLFAWCLIGTRLAVAQSPLPNTQSWRMQNLLGDSGLQDRAVFGLDFLVDGTVWIAASDGLYRYDGYRWQRYTIEDGLPSNFVRAVLVASDGRLWVGTDRGAGVFHWRDEPTRYDPVGGASGQLAGPSVRAIREDDDGTLWFACDHWPDRLVTAGLTSLRGGRCETWREADGLPTDHVQDRYTDSRGRTYVLTEKGLAERRDGRWVDPLEEAGLADHDDVVWSMAEGPRAGLVVACSNGYYVHRAGSWEKLPALDSERPVHLISTNDGSVLSCTNAPYARFVELVGDRIVDASDAIPGFVGSLNVLAEAPDGAVWAAGYNFLVRWERLGGEWIVYENAPAPRVRDGHGGIWMAGGYRVARTAGDVVHVQPQYTSFLAAGPRGDLWLLAPGGVARAVDGKPVVHALPDGLRETDELYRCDAEGKLWIITKSSARILRLADAEWIELEAPPLLPRETIVSAVPDPASGMWCVAGAGEGRSRTYRVLRVADDGMEAIPLDMAAGWKRRPGFLVDGAGSLCTWGRFGASRGTRGRLGIDWRPIETLPGRRAIFGLACGESLWIACDGVMGGSSGLVRYHGGQRDVFDYPSTHFTGLEFGERGYVSYGNHLCVVDGQPDSMPRRLYVPGDYRSDAVVSDGTGALWMRLGPRVARYRPDGERPETIVTAADETVVDGDSLTVVVRAVERFVSSESSRSFGVSTRLDQGSWSGFRPLGSGEITLSDLAIGKHQLFVRVRDEGEDVDATPAVVTFDVIPVPVQLRWWFAPGVGALLVPLIILLLISVIRRRRIAGHAVRLEQTVASRTRDLRASERKYHSLFRHSDGAVFLLDAQGRIEDCNDTAEQTLGICGDEVRGHDIAELFVDERDVRPALDELFRGGRVRDVTTRVRGSGDEVRDVILSASSRREREDDDDATTTESPGYQLFLRDVTRQKRLEERVQQSRKMEAIGRVAAGVAHDFNNVLTIISGYGTLLAERLGDRAALKTGLQSILEASARASRLTEQLQVLGSSPIARAQVVDVRAVVNGLAPMIDPALGGVIELTRELADGCCVSIDQEQLERVLLNLVVNACDAMPDGGDLRIAVRGLRVAPDSEADAPNPGDYVLLEVSDSGPGIDREIVPKIFEPFFTTKSRARARGLGLATVYAIVTAWGGEVAVESPDSGGTTFRVLLPRTSDLPASRQREGNDAPGPRGSETILIADDDGQILCVLSEVLREVGYSVLTARDSFEALDVVAQDDVEIDILVSDVVMPGMDGRELADRLREENPDLPVLFITGYDGPVGRRAGREPALAPLLRKPFLPSDFVRRVREVLDSTLASRDE